jgi:hypothetical protein
MEKAQSMEQKPMLSSSRNGSESDVEPDQLSDSNKGRFGIHILFATFILKELVQGDSFFTLKNAIF